jgi:8-oxo-dGTP diphosphatase
MFIKADSPESRLITFQGAICFCIYQGNLLMLKRSPGSSQGSYWTAAPGGKLEAGETPLEAVLREVFEETALVLDPKKLEFKGTYHCRFESEYLLHIFLTHLSSAPTLLLDPKEHTEMRWATIEEALNMPLMKGAIDCLKTIFPEAKVNS